MKVHILFEQNDHTNGRIVGVWTDRTEAQRAFNHHVGPMIALETGESDLTYGEDSIVYLPDDTEEHSNIKVMLFLDVEVTS